MYLYVNAGLGSIVMIRVFPEMGFRIGIIEVKGGNKGAPVVCIGSTGSGFECLGTENEVKKRIHVE